LKKAQKLPGIFSLNQNWPKPIALRSLILIFRQKPARCKPF
jgi:hypothetical protein